MTFTSSELTYRAYSYKNNSTPVALSTETISLVPDSTNPGSFTAPAGQILLKINYFSLNPIDVKLHNMAIGFVSSFINDKNGFGRDFSGEVVAIGSGAKTDLKVGDLVQGIYPKVYGKGSAADYLLIDPAKADLTRKPENLTLAESSSWPTVLGTALLMSSDLEYKDKKVLVLGGGTSVGRYLVQIAKQRGAREVAATCSTRTGQTLRTIGADTIIDYTKSGNTLVPVLESVKETGTFDYILDCYGGNDLFGEINNILVKGGRYYTIAGDYPGSGFTQLVSSAGRAIGRSALSAIGWLSFNYKFVMFERYRDNINEAKEYLESGKLNVYVDSVFPFTELDQAIDKLESGKTAGKVVVEVSKA
ncbi:Protein YIM1 [Candida viswanathii]|uniref:Protein YIM1 n=1 Tax=Candida viswanathii TaxID=5486 RepID=A0A367XNW7_9ASCO|nr:Protein YIM1 [Candida viswanathii]